MAILSDRFTKALEMIEPSSADKTNAPLAHTAVRDALTSAESLKKWGLKPVLIGSYRRDVSIRRVKDVDVFCRMETPDDTSDRTCCRSSSRFSMTSSVSTPTTRSECGGRTARFRSDFPSTTACTSTRSRRESAPTATGRSRPRTPTSGRPPTRRRLTSLKTAMNDSFNGLYVPGVKLLRQTRRTVLESRPGGLFTELCFYDACKRGVVSKYNQTIVYVTGLEAIASYLDDKVNWGASLPDPTMPGRTLTFRATDKQWEDARDDSPQPQRRPALPTRRKTSGRRQWHSANSSARTVMGTLCSRCRPGTTTTAPSAPPPVSSFPARVGCPEAPVGSGERVGRGTRSHTRAVHRPARTAGIHPRLDEELSGVVEVDDESHHVNVRLGPRFPFAPPAVYPTEDFPRSWHRELDGAMCLYPETGRETLPWLATEDFISMVYRWLLESLHGWTTDSPDLDLQRYFQPSVDDRLLVYEDIEPLLKRYIRLRRDRHTITVMGLGSLPTRR